MLHEETDWAPRGEAGSVAPASRTSQSREERAGMELLANESVGDASSWLDLLEEGK